MPFIQITDEAHRALADFNMKDVGRGVGDKRSVQHDDGSWDIWVGEDTYDNLEAISREGESFSAVILRLTQGRK